MPYWVWSCCPEDEGAIYVCIALIGLDNSNVFSVIFAQAITRKPNEANEVSGLMIMGLFGGALFPLAMGLPAMPSRARPAP